jgi:hypothetical protein
MHSFYLASVMASVLILTGCNNQEDQAKKLGFNDVAEMKSLQAKGFNNRKDYVQNLLKDSGCNSEEEYNHAISEVNGNCNKLKDLRLKEEAEFQLAIKIKKDTGINCMAEYAASIFVHKGLWNIYARENGFNRQVFGATQILIIDKSATYLTLVSNKNIGHSADDNEEIWSRARKTATANYNGLNSFNDLASITKNRTSECVNLIDEKVQQNFATKILEQDQEVISLIPKFMLFPNLP